MHRETEPLRTVETVCIYFTWIGLGIGQWPLVEEAQDLSGASGTGRSFPLGTPVFPCLYHSIFMFILVTTSSCSPWTFYKSDDLFEDEKRLKEKR